MAGGAPELRRGARSSGYGKSAMINSAGERPLASPLRLTLASQLGHSIDGAWWPRTARTARELPELIAVLRTPLGAIIDIEVNWSASQNPPKLDTYGWEGKHQHVMTISGRNGSANLLIVPHRTSTALAIMVLRLAAGLPIYPPHRDTQAYRTAECIVRAARNQRKLDALRPTRSRPGQHDRTS